MYKYDMGHTLTGFLIESRSAQEYQEFEATSFTRCRTPWGKADSVCFLGQGILQISTPSHGGLKISPKLNSLIPSEFRHSDGWYEEDCDYAIPYYFIPDRHWFDKTWQKESGDRATYKEALIEALISLWHWKNRVFSFPTQNYRVFEVLPEALELRDKRKRALDESLEAYRKQKEREAQNV